MDRTQFCAMLKDARKLAGVSIVNLCYNLQKTESAVKKLLDCNNDYGMKKVMDYLHAINSCIEIQNDTNRHELWDFADVTKCVNTLCESLNGEQFAKQYDVSHQTAGRIFKGADIRMSTFLKVIEANGFKIYIHPKEAQINSAVNDCDIE